MNKWIKSEPISCGTIMRWRESVIECQCPECKRWCLKWADTNDYEKCPHCGAGMKGGSE